MNKLPRVFSIDSYLNLKTFEKIPMEEVDNILYDLTEDRFESYYQTLKEIELNDFYNRKLFEYSKERFAKLSEYLLKKPQMKQRDALAYLYGIEDPDIVILMNIVKNFPKEYQRVLKGVQNEFKKYDSEVTYDTICDRAMDVETLDTLTEFLPPAKKREQELVNYIYCVVKDLTTSVLNSEEYKRYRDEAYNKEYYNEISTKLVDKFDAYRKKNYDKFQKECAQDIVPLFDYVLENKLISFLDDGKYVMFVDEVIDKGDTLELISGSSHTIIDKKDIKGFRCNGTSVTIQYEKI